MEAFPCAVQIPALLACCQYTTVDNMQEIVIVSEAVSYSGTRGSSNATHCVTGHSTWFIAAVQSINTQQMTE